MRRLDQIRSGKDRVRRVPVAVNREEAGGAIPGAEGPAFRLIGAGEARIPVLIAVPHAGRNYPDSLIANLAQPDEAQRQLEDRHVDAIALRVAMATGAALLVAEAPRAMIDLNRDSEDVDWSMIAGIAGRGERSRSLGRRARSGLGLIPRRVAGLGELWRQPISRIALDERIEAVHRPYHDALSRTLERLRDRWGAASLLDLHSMPPLKPRNNLEDAPQFVIGDRFGAACDAALTNMAYRFFERRGRSVALNRPYSGGYVLDRHAQPRRQINAMQLEICRSTYLDRALDQTTARLGAIADTVADMVAMLGEQTEAIGGRDGWRTAAE